jgi:predicted dehydrogenase
MGDLNIGIVGLGWVAGAHIETFKAVQGANVTAICSRTDHDPKELDKKFGIPLKVYTDYGKMLADKDIHVIDICTPHPFHPDQAVAAAEAGKHLIIEKPISLNFADAKRVKEAIHKAKVKACVCFEVRFSAQFTMIRNVVEQGLIGDIHYGEVDYYHGIGPWYGQFGWNVKKDMGGSSLLTAGVHALDSLLMCIKSPVEEVMTYATTSKSKVFEPYEYPTTTTTILKFEEGQVGKCASVIDCFQPYYFHSHLVGSEGSLLDNKIYTEKLPGMTKARWSTLETALIDSGDVSDHPYQPQFQALVESINNDTTMPQTDFDTAYETHRVAFAADISAAEGRPVKLSELK